jgi:hypothetical protein
MEEIRKIASDLGNKQKTNRQIILEFFKKYDILLISIFCGIMIIFFWFYTYYSLIKVDKEVRGTFGDMFGGLNTLFSGFAFLGIIITILLQKKDLKLQSDELKLTRKEFEIQNDTLKTQKFENTFFNLLNIHHQIVENIDCDVEKEKKYKVKRGYKNPFLDSNKIGSFFPKDEEDRVIEYNIITLKGRDFFEYKYFLLQKQLQRNPEIEINEIYTIFFTTVNSDLGHYFRNLYRIIKMIDDTKFIANSNLDSDFELTKDDKQIETLNYEIQYRYTSILRSQLSDYEILWLFYNCITDNGKEKFKPLIIKYKILKNLQVNKLHSKEFIENFNYTLNNFNL